MANLQRAHVALAYKNNGAIEFGVAKFVTDIAVETMHVVDIATQKAVEVANGDVCGMVYMSGDTWKIKGLNGGVSNDLYTAFERFRGKIHEHVTLLFTVTSDSGPENYQKVGT